MPVIVQRQVRSLRGNVVDISVVAQRQFPLVLFRKTIEILQLQFIDKVVDFVVQVQQVRVQSVRRQSSSTVAAR